VDVRRDALPLLLLSLDQARQEPPPVVRRAEQVEASRVRVREEALDLLRASGAVLPRRELTRMVNEVSDEVVGFGPIEFLLKDPEVTEVSLPKEPSLGCLTS